MYLLLDVERRRIDDESRPVLDILSPPIELGIADLYFSGLVRVAVVGLASA